MPISPELERAIKRNPSRWVLFVGAGLSVSKVKNDQSGFPDWETLMELMIKDLKSNPRCSKDKLIEVEKCLIDNEYLVIAETFHDIKGPYLYLKFLQDIFMSNDIARSDIHKTILGTNYSGIITTNFDCVFEEQTNFVISSREVYPYFLKTNDWLKKPGFFLKIHGCITCKVDGEIVLTQSNYKNLNANTTYQRDLETVCDSHSILTVGYSLLDPDFKNILRNMKRKYGNNPEPIFVLALDPGTIKCIELMTDNNIAIQPYESHDQLLPIFEEIQSLIGKRIRYKPRTKTIVKNKQQREMIPTFKQLHLEPLTYKEPLTKESDGKEYSKPFQIDTGKADLRQSKIEEIDTRKTSLEGADIKGIDSSRADLVKYLLDKHLGGKKEILVDYLVNLLKCSNQF